MVRGYTDIDGINKDNVVAFVAVIEEGTFVCQVQELGVVGKLGVELGSGDIVAAEAILVDNAVRVETD